MMTLSENAEKGKTYFIRGKKDWMRRTDFTRSRQPYRVVKEFSDTDTGVLVRDVDHGIELDLPAGIEFHETQTQEAETITEIAETSLKFYCPICRTEKATSTPKGEYNHMSAHRRKGEVNG